MAAKDTCLRISTYKKSPSFLPFSGKPKSVGKTENGGYRSAATGGTWSNRSDVNRQLALPVLLRGCQVAEFGFTKDGDAEVVGFGEFRAGIVACEEVGGFFADAAGDFAAEAADDVAGLLAGDRESACEDPFQKGVSPTHSHIFNGSVWFFRKFSQDAP